MDPKSTKGLNIKPNCADPTFAPTICDPRLRTMNTHAECGSAEDVYYYSPWRAPGEACWRGTGVTGEWWAAIASVIGF